MDRLPSRSETLSDDCVRHLRGAILRGEIGVGERLPPERVLAERFGVNRVTVRAALARLASSGLVRVRQGQGYTVQDYRRSGGSDLLGVLAQQEAGEGRLANVVADLLLVRRKLARAVLERLLEQRPDPAGLAARTKAFSAAVGTGASPGELAVLEGEILGELLAQTRSPVLQLCLNPIRLVLSELPVLVEAMFREPERNAHGWQLLAAWMADPALEGLDLMVTLLEEQDAETVRLVARP